MIMLICLDSQFDTKATVTALDIKEELASVMDAPLRYASLRAGEKLNIPACVWF